MQGLILAAGMDKRLKELTQDNTKCMVKIKFLTGYSSEANFVRGALEALSLFELRLSRQETMINCCPR